MNRHEIVVSQGPLSTINQTKMKVSVKRNMLNTLQHENRFRQYECHTQKEPSFFYRNILKTVFTKSEIFGRL